MTKKEKIYVITQFLVSFTGATWFQIAYNEPKLLVDKGWKELLATILMSLALASANTGITWLSYLSDPNETKTIKPIEPPKTPAQILGK